MSSALEDSAPNRPRSRKGAETRSRLLDAAKTVFENSGFLEARVSDIATEAGLSHGSFYHYFDSKEQVFRELAEHYETLLTASADQSESAELDGQDAERGQDADRGDADGDRSQLSDYERIRAANRLYLERYKRNGRIMAVIEEVSRYDREVNQARMERQRHFADRSERSIRRLQEAGKADQRIDPELAAVALGSMVARTAEVLVVEDWADYDLDTVADQLTRLWANALGMDIED